MDNNQIQSTSELAIRREKLANLVSAGKNPFEITKYEVTHTAPVAIAEFEESIKVQMEEGSRERVSGDEI